MVGSLRRFNAQGVINGDRFLDLERGGLISLEQMRVISGGVRNRPARIAPGNPDFSIIPALL